MAFDDRLLCLLLGMAIGFVLGYLVRLVREIKEELDEVDEIVKKELGSDDDDQNEGPHRFNEKGFMRYPVLADIAVLLAVGLTAYASFVSQKASNDVQDGQHRIQVVTYCNLKVTSEALNALNERSFATSQSTQANTALQTDFARFFNLLLHQPPFTPHKRLVSAKAYQRSLNNFVEKAHASKQKLEENPFPTSNDLRNCVNQGKTTGE